LEPCGASSRAEVASLVFKSGCSCRQSLLRRVLAALLWIPRPASFAIKAWCAEQPRRFLPAQEIPPSRRRDAPLDAKSRVSEPNAAIPSRPSDAPIGASDAALAHERYATSRASESRCVTKTHLSTRMAAPLHQNGCSSGSSRLAAAACGLYSRAHGTTIGDLLTLDVDGEGGYPQQAQVRASIASPVGSHFVTRRVGTRVPGPRSAL
jgi:hypothetical protein